MSDRAPDGGPLTTDVLIVGAGPVGLYGAYYAGARGLSVTVMDSLPEPGGQVAAMYPEKPIYDVGGFPSVLGRELVDNLVEQAGTFDPRYLLAQEGMGLRMAGERPVVRTASGLEVDSGVVILTAGIGAFSPRPLPAGGDWLGRGLAYFVPSLAEYAGEDVVIVGGGDSAFDWALALFPIARTVTLVHRTDRFRAHASTVARVRALGVPVLVHQQVREIRGDTRVREVEVAEKSGATAVLPATRVVAALGFTADLGPLESWGMEMSGRHIAVDTRMATTLPRVYAAGDITEYPGKVRLISVGFGEVALAVNNAAVALDPGAHLFPGHSSDRPTDQAADHSADVHPSAVAATSPDQQGALA